MADEIIPSPTKSALCLSCGKCCTRIGIPTAFRYSDTHAVEFYKARGWDTVDRNGRLMISREEACPHLQETELGKSCGIYENRPQSCRDYSCMNDLDVLGDTKWSEYIEKSQPASTDNQVLNLMEKLK